MEIKLLEEMPVEEVLEKKKKLNLTMLYVLIFIGMVAAAGWYWFFTKGNLPWPQNMGDNQGELRYLISIKEFQTNLADQGARRYIRLKIYLGSNDRSLAKEVERREPELRSVIITILRSTKVSDLEGGEGMDLLKSNILEQSNALILSGEIEDVFFDEFIIQ